MVTVAPSTSFEATAQFDTGLAGTLGVRIIDNAGATTLARQTTGIAEYPAISGIYAVTLTSPATAGQYTLVWDDAASPTTNYATEDLLVTTADNAATIGSGTLYITSAEMKTALSLTGQTYADDDIADACTTVSRAIDRACGKGRRFYQATETRYYDPYLGPYSSRIGCETRIDIDDLTSASSVTIDTAGDGTYATTWVENTDFYLDPVNAAADGFPYEQILLRVVSGSYIPSNVQRAVKVTGTFGWPSVPPEVSQYAKIFAAQLIMRSRQAPFGILMQGMEVGATARLMRIDPDFERLLGPFIKRRPFL